MNQQAIEANEEMLPGPEGLGLFTRSWHPAGPARAVVVLVHGLKAHSGLYEWAARQLVARDFAVYALDLRGHGRSGGEALYIDRFSQWVDDVASVVDAARARDPGLPVFVLGHSAGGLVSSAYALEHQDELAGFVCESFAQEVPAPNAVLSIIKGISKLAPRAGVFALKDDDFSRDPGFVQRMKLDPFIRHDIRYPAQTVAELRRAEERMDLAFPEMNLPVLILHGTSDHVTSPHGSQHFFDTAGSTDKKLELYPGHFHDLLNDVGREKVMADITDWIDAHVQSYESTAMAE